MGLDFQEKLKNGFPSPPQLTHNLKLNWAKQQALNQRKWPIGEFVAAVGKCKSDTDDPSLCNWTGGPTAEHCCVQL